MSLPACAVGGGGVELMGGFKQEMENSENSNLDLHSLINSELFNNITVLHELLSVYESIEM